MDEKELDLLLGKVADQTKTSISALKTEINATLSGVMKTTELAIKLEALGLKDGVIETLTKAIETQGLEMRKLLNPGGEPQAKSVREHLTEKQAELNQISKTGKGLISFDIPIAQKTIVTTASVSGYSVGLRLPGISDIPYLGMRMSSLFPHVAVPPEMNNTVIYIDQATVTRGAAGRSENALFGESVVTWAERHLHLDEIADSIPVTKESMKFISFMEGEINKLMRINIELKEDEYLWDGTGVAPISTGILTYATAFVPATYAATSGVWLPTKANIFDLALVLQEQISNGYESKYTANFVLINPGDAIGMHGVKNLNGDYVRHPLMIGNNLNGMEVIISSQVDKGTMVVGDSRFATIYDGEALTIEAGYVADQFKYGALTIRAYKRLGLLVRTGDAAAFLKVTDINAALGSIEYPTA